MSKRYFESTMFTDPWFRKLSPHAKLFWTFLCSQCDASGIWERDDDYARYLTGLKKDVNDLLEELGNRVVSISPEKTLLPKFILFQQGKTLSEAKPPHRGILKLLQKHDLEMDENGITKPKVNLSLTKAKAKPSQEVTKPLVTSNSNSKGNSIVNIKERGKGKTIPNDPPESLKDDLSFLAVWDEWKAYRKERGLRPYKPMGLKALHTQLTKWAKTHGAPALIQSIRDSMANDYKGLFEPKLTKNQPDPNTIVYDEHAFDLSRH